MAPAMLLQDEAAPECGGVVVGGSDDAELRMFGERDVGNHARRPVKVGDRFRGQ